MKLERERERGGVGGWGVGVGWDGGGVATESPGKILYDEL